MFILTWEETDSFIDVLNLEKDPSWIGQNRGPWIPGKLDTMIGEKEEKLVSPY